LPSRAAALSGHKILVIDDDVRNLFAVTSLLEKRGAQVIPAGSARESFEVLERTPDVSLVLMDMMMPEIDGYEATRRLRRDPRYRDLPIVALTAKAMPGDRERVIEAGCDDFVAKPVEQDQLVSVLAQWLEKEQAT
jgi:CheY-like chemotaxis protein